MNDKNANIATPISRPTIVDTRFFLRPIMNFFLNINENGLTRLDGSMPINTSGGLKCKGHPVGATGIGQLYEVWTQLRNSAGERQVPNKNLRIGAAHNLGGTGGTCTFTILEKR